MNIMDKISEIRSCIEILGSDIKTHTNRQTDRQTEQCSNSATVSMVS